MQQVDKEQVKAFLLALQDQICQALADVDGGAEFQRRNMGARRRWRWP